ncbi:DUF3068 domain-containing protein [Actinomadura sp. WMMB 499]|uniref:DUF3068 domain-containing protein n=1 Tax=Actinomadura sp. WMMB 499 TaxID=1219491 RepID=UPI001248B641|nr:DUF3068 domain-containing protein [Actinomadura sp. WMMB 499]QFG20113.1 DUF3068 domain-containing protein [Actinomadura sp. WMMB 499]
MRSAAVVMLAGFGVFLLVTGVLVREYVAPTLVRAPTDIYKVQRLRAENASYFDAGKLQVRTGASVTATATVRGDVRASGDDVAVWDMTTVIEDPERGYLIDVATRRLAFDRRTGELVHCCGAAVQGDASVRQSGIGVFWPTEVERRTYRMFDVQTRRSWPIEFTGVEEVGGIEAYRFEMHVPRTKVAAETPDVPARLLGLDGDGAVPVDRYYQGDSVTWVDPRTGAPIGQRQRVRSTLQARSGPGSLVVADLEMRMTPQDAKALAGTANDAAAQVRMLRTIVPLGAAALGVVLLASGILLDRRGGRNRRRTAAPAGGPPRRPSPRKRHRERTRPAARTAGPGDG